MKSCDADDEQDWWATVLTSGSMWDVPRAQIDAHIWLLRVLLLIHMALFRRCTSQVLVNWLLRRAAYKLHHCSCWAPTKTRHTVHMPVNHAAQTCPIIVFAIMVS